MFEELIESSQRKPPKRRLNFILSGGLHLSLIATVVFVSSFLPQAGANLQVVFTPTPLAGPVTLGGRSVALAVNDHHGENPERGMTTPSQIPDEINPDAGTAKGPADCDNCGGKDPDFLPGIGNGNTDGLRTPETGLVQSPPLLPPPVNPTSRPTRPIPVGGDVQNANLIFQMRPNYPSSAIIARIQGNVVFNAIISLQGVVKDLRVVSGHPALVPAAMDAVKQWRYRPTLLNHEPVEVETTITVSFKLG